MPPSLSTQEITGWTRKLNYGTWRFQKNWSPIHVVDAEGCYFIDGHGKRYLDFSAQLMCVNPGPKNPAVIEAITDSGPRPALHCAWLRDGRASVELSRLLLEVLPKGSKKLLFTTSGTEANEAAIKIARLLYRQDENHRALSFVSRLDHGVYCGHRRSQALAIGTWRQRSGRHLCARGELLSCPIGHQYPGRHCVRGLHRALSRTKAMWLRFWWNRLRHERRAGPPPGSSPAARDLRPE